MVAGYLGTDVNFLSGPLLFFESAFGVSAASQYGRRLDRPHGSDSGCGDDSKHLFFVLGFVWVCVCGVWGKLYEEKKKN